MMPGLLNPNRDWGENAMRNQWISGVTGYGGDFGNGQFSQWGQNNGWDASTLANVYNSMQPGQFHGGMGQFQGGMGGYTSAPPAGWGGSSALGGLLGGYTPMFGGYGATNFGMPTYSSNPGFAGVSPTQSARMLWTA